MVDARMMAQPIPNSITNFPVTIPLVLIITPKKASVVPTIDTITLSGVG
jgi:hypothetical protein